MAGPRSKEVGGKGEMEVGVGGREGERTNLTLHCHQQNDYTLKWAAA